MADHVANTELRLYQRHLKRFVIFRIERGEKPREIVCFDSENAMLAAWFKPGGYGEEPWSFACGVEDTTLFRPDPNEIEFVRGQL